MNNTCNILLYQYFLSVQIANIDKKIFSCKLTIEWCFFITVFFFHHHTVTLWSKWIVPQSIKCGHEHVSNHEFLGNE